MAAEAGPIPAGLLAGKPDDPCPFCKRSIIHLMKHHLVPKSLGGKVQLVCCRDCHKAAHAFISNKEMKRYYHTVERLLEHKGFRNMVAWIAKQDPARKVKIERPKDQRGRGKYR
jgi:hypothetical protein